MTDSPIPQHVVIQCSGLIVHHRDNWWLVPFLEPDHYPTRPRLLSGDISTDLANRLGFETRPRMSLPRVTALNPGSECWSGEFTLRGTIPGGNPDHIEYDIDAHVLGGAAGKLEERLARARIDIERFPIPAEFISVFTGLPLEREFVLAIRTSAYRLVTFELLTARYMPDEHPDCPWRDISGDSVGDSGDDILGWMPARNWLKPR